MKKTSRVPDSEKNIGYPVKPDRDRISGTSLVLLAFLSMCVCNPCSLSRPVATRSCLEHLAAPHVRSGRCHRRWGGEVQGSLSEGNRSSGP